MEISPKEKLPAQVRRKKEKEEKRKKERKRRKKEPTNKETKEGERKKENNKHSRSHEFPSNVCTPPQFTVTEILLCVRYWRSDSPKVKAY